MPKVNNGPSIIIFNGALSSLAAGWTTGTTAGTNYYGGY
jgi:hypothetical protein